MEKDTQGVKRYTGGSEVSVGQNEYRNKFLDFYGLGRLFKRAFKRWGR